MPTSGWFVKNCLGTWQEDPTITVTSEPLTNICNNLTISYNGPYTDQFADCIGLFTDNKSWYNGRPVYVNIHGRLLYVGYDGYWAIGDISSPYEYFALRSTGAPVNPIDARKWKYGAARVSEHNDANISINCNDP